MNLTIQRETLLKPINAVIGVVERRQTLPILANIYLSIEGQELKMIATDLEVELQSRITLDQAVAAPIKLTIPGRKLADICRSLPEQADIELIYEQDKLLLRSGRSRFTLTTLPAADFPLQREAEQGIEFTLEQKNLRYLTQRTHFAMAQQDVRYYLNGMLLDISHNAVKAVATDGHRLSYNTVPINIDSETAPYQVILPRKAVIELMRLLDDSDQPVAVQLSNNYVRIKGLDFTFTAKLIDGRFPDYEKVLPRGGDKSILVDRELFKQALTRASILSNEKFRGIRVHLKPGMLKISANNPEHEEAEEEISLDYQKDELETGFNVTYLLDVLNILQQPEVKITFSDGKNSILIEEPEGGGNSLFVVMPMML